jgi:hypothetical protein
MPEEIPPAAVSGSSGARAGLPIGPAPLSGKRLLALWNALPGVEKRKKVGDRDALIDQLWSAIEMLPPGTGSGRRPFDSWARFWAIAGTDDSPLYRRRSCIRSVAVAHPGEAARDLEHRNGTVVGTYLSSQTVDKS